MCNLFQADQNMVCVVDLPLQTVSRLMMVLGDQIIVEFGKLVPNAIEEVTRCRLAFFGGLGIGSAEMRVVRMFFWLYLLASCSRSITASQVRWSKQLRCFRGCAQCTCQMEIHIA